MEQAIQHLSQADNLREAVDDQFLLLHDILTRIKMEDERSKSEFDSTLRDLDHLNGGLNSALEVLQNTNLPLSLSDSPGARPSDHPKSSAESLQNTSCYRTKRTLFEFADDTAVEQVKSQLRQTVDEIQVRA